VHQGDISSYVECAISVVLKQDYNYNRLEETAFRGPQTSAECVPVFFASVDVMEFQTSEAYSILDRTSVKYSMNIIQEMRNCMLHCELDLATSCNEKI
jgi:hypothetical protein